MSNTLMDDLYKTCESCAKRVYSPYQIFGCQFGRMKKMRDFCYSCATEKLGAPLPANFEEGYTYKGLLYYCDGEHYYCNGAQISWREYGQYPADYDKVEA